MKSVKSVRISRVHQCFLLISNAVWVLRGWSHLHNTAKSNNPFYYGGKDSSKFEISRADSKPIPSWQEVEHKQDGKHRIGYNPAAETREISQEDFQTVKANSKRYNGGANAIQFPWTGGAKAGLSKL